MLSCFLLGHKYVNIQTISSDGFYIVKCIKCGKEAKWSGEMCCRVFGHDCDIIGVHSAEFTSWSLSKNYRSGNYTARIYKCKRCEYTYSDDTNNLDSMLPGRWILYNGKLLDEINAGLIGIKWKNENE